MGVGFLDATLEWYFIFSDDYRSQIETKSKLTDFKETKVPQNAVIAKVQVQSIESQGYWDGVFCGIRFLDRKGKTLMEAGRINAKSEEYFIAEFDLVDGERLVGVKSSLLEPQTARHWNLEFTLGHK